MRRLPLFRLKCNLRIRKPLRFISGRNTNMCFCGNLRTFCLHFTFRAWTSGLWTSRETYNASLKAYGRRNLLEVSQIFSSFTTNLVVAESLGAVPGLFCSVCFGRGSHHKFQITLFPAYFLPSCSTNLLQPNSESAQSWKSAVTDV